MATIAVGLALSFAVWGRSTLSPLTFAATRRSNCLSIFRFLRGRYSPLRWFTSYPNIDYLAPIILFVALLRAWSWYRVRHPESKPACVVAVTTTALFYQTGFPQYHMVPFALGAPGWSGTGMFDADKSPRAIAVACYFGWLAVFDSYYFAEVDGSRLLLGFRGGHCRAPDIRIRVRVRGCSRLVGQDGDARVTRPAGQCDARWTGRDSGRPRPRDPGEGLAGAGHGRQTDARDAEVAGWRPGGDLFGGALVKLGLPQPLRGVITDDRR